MMLQRRSVLLPGGTTSIICSSRGRHHSSLSAHEGQAQVVVADPHLGHEAALPAALAHDDAPDEVLPLEGHRKVAYSRLIGISSVSAPTSAVARRGQGQIIALQAVELGGGLSG